MNQTEIEHLKRITDLCVNRRHIIDEQAATIARLTAANESMQEDSVQNTCAFNLMLTANKAQAEEIRTLKGLLENSRIALTFYREWMFSHAETRYPFGHEIESEIALKLAGES